MRVAIVLMLALCACAAQPLRYPRRWWLYDTQEWSKAQENGRCEERAQCCLMPIVPPPVQHIRYFTRCCRTESDDVRCSG